MTHVERRLEILEAQNRRLRAGFGALTAAVAAVFLLGASDGVVNLIQARRIEIVDAAGHPLVVLGEKTEGGTLLLKNQRNQDLVSLGYDADGNGHIRTTSAAGSALTDIGAGDGAGAIVTYDRASREHVKLGTTQTGAGALTTFAADGTRLISLTATTTGDGLVAALGSNGGVRASWP
jgi:hypothetical protein